MNRNFVAWTGPSLFDASGIHMIEEALECNPMILRQNNSDFLMESLDLCKGVVIAGGVDIHPSVYGACVFTDHNLSKFDHDRDFRELMIIKYCLSHNIPMFGICRGHQMLGVYHGMELVQDISDGVVCHAPKSHGVYLKNNEPAHHVKIKKGFNFELTEEEWGKRQAAFQHSDEIREKHKNHYWVNSFHHQAINFDKQRYERLPIEIIGISQVHNGRVENIVELMTGENWLSCQWHPEYDWDANPCSKKVVLKFKELLEQ